MCYPCIIAFRGNLIFWSMGAYLFQNSKRSLTSCQSYQLAKIELTKQSQ